MLVAQPAHPRQVVLAGHHHAGLALDGLEHDSDDVLPAGPLELRPDRAHVVIGKRVQPGHVGPEACVRGRVGAGADSRHGPAPKVALGKEHAGLVVAHPLHVVAPLAGELDCRLAALDARVHGKHFVVAEELGDVLLVLAQDGVVEGPRGEREARGLRYQRLEDFRMGVALVDGRVG